MTGSEFLRFLQADFPALSSLQEEHFLALDALYREWNARINVISRKDIDNLYSHHVLHSLALARYFLTREGLWERFSAASVLDLGTGGGFPGIPLAILFPEAEFALCDSVGKKTIVADAVSKALQLENVTVVNARAESLGRRFDFVVSRAVASLPELYPWVKGHFTGGVYCLKGGDVAGEIAEVMQRNRLRRGAVCTWPVNAWLRDPYFEGKLIVGIEP